MLEWRGILGKDVRKEWGPFSIAWGSGVKWSGNVQGRGRGKGGGEKPERG